MESASALTSAKIDLLLHQVVLHSPRCNRRCRLAIVSGEIRLFARDVLERSTDVGRWKFLGTAMAQYDEKLTAIAEQLKKGVIPPKESVRGFLLWFDSERRGLRVIRRARSALRHFGVATSPDFESTYIDSQLTFIRAPEAAEGPNGVVGDSAPDPTYRISRLASANRVPVSVAPDAPLQQVTTLMMSKDYSQLPAMTGTRKTDES